MNMTREDRRIWFTVLLMLGALLPGFPLLMIVTGVLLSMIGLSGQVFTVALTMHNLYYALPATAFRETHFPAEEFGYLPTLAVTALAECSIPTPAGMISIKAEAVGGDTIVELTPAERAAREFRLRGDYSGMVFQLDTM